MGTNKNSCKTAAVMNLLSRGTPGRDTQAQPPQIRDIEAITGEILEAKRAGGEAILTIGRGLMEAKALLPHGEWLPWLEERVEFSEKAAQRFMLLARKYSNPTALSDLGATKALMLLAIPDDARDEFMAAPHLVDGKEKAVADMTSRELEQVIKERDAALKAAEESKAERQAAEQAREKLSQEMDFANRRIAGLNDLVERQSAEARACQEEFARLTAELKQLRERPIDVAVEADAGAIKAAREEAKAAMRAKVDRAKAAQKKAEEAQAAAQKELERVRAEIRVSQERDASEKQALREQMERAEKKAALSGNEDLMLFRTLFEQVQEHVNRLGGIVMKLQGKDPEAAQGLGRAMLALAEKIKGVAQG